MGALKKRYQVDYFRFYDVDKNGARKPRWQTLSLETDLETAQKRASDELDLYMHCRGVRVIDRITGEVVMEYPPLTKYQARQ